MSGAHPGCVNDGVDQKLGYVVRAGASVNELRGATPLRLRQVASAALTR